MLHLCQRPGADTEETDYDLARGKICVVFWMLSVNSNELSKNIVISFMFMDICNPSENSCFSKIFPVLLKCDFSWFQPIIGRFYKMRVSWEFNIYNLFKSFY